MAHFLLGPEVQFRGLLATLKIQGLLARFSAEGPPGDGARTLIYPLHEGRRSMACRLDETVRADVLRLRGEGVSTREVAAQLGISQSSVVRLCHRSEPVGEPTGQRVSTWDHLVDRVAAAPTPRQSPRHIRSDHPVTAILDISDVHAGAVVHPEDVGGLAEYDGEVFRRRMDRLVEAIYAVADSTDPVDNLHVNFLGDIVDGESIYPGHGRDIEASLAEQVLEFGDVWIEAFFPHLLRRFPQVTCHCVIGNHGRTGRKGENHFRSNGDYFTYRLWERRTRDWERLAWDIPRSPWGCYILHGRWHWLSHGDTVRGWSSLPWYGLSSLHARAQSMTKRPIWAVHVGHFHRAGGLMLESGGFAVINGSWVGGSDLSVNRLHAASIPAQWFRTVDHKRLIGQWLLELDDPAIYSAQAAG